jgi:hypothetical protein
VIETSVKLPLETWKSMLQCSIQYNVLQNEELEKASLSFPSLIDPEARDQCRANIEFLTESISFQEKKQERLRLIIQELEELAENY